MKIHYRGNHTTHTSSTKNLVNLFQHNHYRCAEIRDHRSRKLQEVLFQTNVKWTYALRSPQLFSAFENCGKVKDNINFWSGYDSGYGIVFLWFEVINMLKTSASDVIICNSQISQLKMKYLKVFIYIKFEVGFEMRLQEHSYSS